MLLNLLTEWLVCSINNKLYKILTALKQILFLLTLLILISPFKLMILFINKYKKYYNSSNFASIKIKLLELIELKFSVKMNSF
jgi:hypothetical protein